MEIVHHQLQSVAVFLKGENQFKKHLNKTVLWCEKTLSLLCFCYFSKASALLSLVQKSPFFTLKHLHTHTDKELKVPINYKHIRMKNNCHQINRTYFWNHKCQRFKTGSKGLWFWTSRSNWREHSCVCQNCDRPPVLAQAWIREQCLTAEPHYALYCFSCTVELLNSKMWRKRRKLTNLVE